MPGGKQNKVLGREERNFPRNEDTHSPQTAGAWVVKRSENEEILKSFHRGARYQATTIRLAVEIISNYWCWNKTEIPKFWMESHFIFFKLFYCSITVVWVYPPPLPRTPAKPHLPLLLPYPPWFCPCVLYSCSWKPSPHCPLLPPLWLLLDCS